MGLYTKFEKSRMYDSLKSIVILRTVKRAIQKKIFNQKWELHGDINLRKMFDILIKEVNPTSIVETGTYMGYTSGFLAAKYPEIPIYTCEINKKFYLSSEKKLRRLKNVQIILGDSPTVLNDLITKKIVGERPLFFLDAHWEENWPIEKEIKIISEKLKSAVILIDDFKIDGDDRFRYDVYGDKECSLERVIPNINTKNSYNLFFPNYGPDQAFRKGIPHSRLTGYPVIFQNIPSVFKKLKIDEFVEKYFLDKSNLMKP